ncbi:MAG: type 12 methyltransferase [Candidatus Poribacteria bacterium]|nr:MAG: type 12 methyltransferase [Candidatus Poribacteria bacterium]
MSEDLSGTTSDAFTRAVADLYDFYFRGVPGDVEFYVRQAKEQGGPALELGCGTGRVAAALAEAGVPTVGVDREREMLSRAAVRVAGLGPAVQARLSLVCADMRALPFQGSFASAILAYNSFLHLLTPSDQLACLHSVREALRPGGVLICHLFDPDPYVLATRDGRIERSAGFLNPRTGRRVLVELAGRVDPTEQRMTQTFFFEEIDQEGRSVSRRAATLTLRYVYRWEMEHLLARCGFRVRELFGGFREEPYRPRGEQVWIAERL